MGLDRKRTVFKNQHTTLSVKLFLDTFDSKVLCMNNPLFCTWGFIGSLWQSQYLNPYFLSFMPKPECHFPKIRRSEPAPAPSLLRWTVLPEAVFAVLAVSSIPGWKNGSFQCFQHGWLHLIVQSVYRAEMSSWVVLFWPLAELNDGRAHFLDFMNYFDLTSFVWEGRLDKCSECGHLGCQPPK